MTHFLIAVLLLAPLALVQAATLTLSSPLDYQVIQRSSKYNGAITISGEVTDAGADTAAIDVRIGTKGHAGEWQRVGAQWDQAQFRATFDAPAGGWYRLEVRAVARAKVLAESAVDPIGIGEVFVIAGQSNSANYGSEKQSTKTGRVSAFDGKKWQIANDPQPGADGNGGSFMAPFGDAMVDRLGVPVGIIACGAGGTSVRHWLPKGTRSPILPTGSTSHLPSGEWESDGGLFNNLIARMKAPGPRGFRAVLWHQGESDANQADPARTLPGKLYREYLESIIRLSRSEVGWDAPWFVAQVSYHVPGDEASPDIRAAQASLWKDSIALEGPDTDALKGDLRENGGKGVHFSGPGLRAHAALWVEKVAPWLEQQLR